MSVADRQWLSLRARGPGRPGRSSAHRIRICTAGLLLALGICAAAHAWAAQVLTLTVTRQGAAFLIGMRMAIDAPSAQVFRALRDYEALPRYNPDVRAVRVEPAARADSVRLFTTIHSCVLLFCKTLLQEQLMTTTRAGAGGVVQQSLVARPGAFAGAGQWQVRACGSAPARSCLEMRMRLVPMFWLPPVIGPWVVRRKMLVEARDTGAGLEQMALESSDTHGR